jgi:FAD/FMN-containing dehydrogenase
VNTIIVELTKELAAIVGRPNLIVDREALMPFETDYTRRWHGEALLAVAPSSTDDVARVLSVCQAAGVGVVVQGGNTGLVGGAVPADEVVLLTRRLDVLEPIDSLASQVTVGAGVTLEAAQRHVRADGLDLPVDLAARSAATIGGMTATNAGGALAVRYGTMAAAVAGMEVVLGDGKIVSRLSGLLKDTAGYDLARLLVGSEGTLGVITRVRLRLIRHPTQRLVAVAGFGSLVDAARAALTLRDRLGPSLEAADYVDAAGVRLVRDRRRLPPPLAVESGHLLVIQVAGEDVESLLPVVSETLDAAGVTAVSVADDTSGRERLWTYREAVNESIGAQGLVHKFDASIPLGAIPEFAAETHEAVALVDPAATVVIYGHLADGNLHVNVLSPDLDHYRVEQALGQLVAQHNGSISAEHGIGIAKRDLLTLVRSDDDIAAMRAVKAALDPEGLLGRHRVLREE